MTKENTNNVEPSADLRASRVGYAKKKFKEFLITTIITVGVVAASLAVGPVIGATFPAYSGVVTYATAGTAVLGGMFAFLNVWMLLRAAGVIVTGGKYYPGYIRTAGDDTKPEDIVEAHEPDRG